MALTKINKTSDLRRDVFNLVMVTKNVISFKLNVCGDSPNRVANDEIMNLSMAVTVEAQKHVFSSPRKIVAVA